MLKHYPYLPHRITSNFGNRKGANLPAGGTAWHNGIDIGRDTSKYSNAWSNAPCGPVYAMLDGIITESRHYNDRGYTIKIDHGTINNQKVATLYQHLHKDGMALTSQKVKAGDKIAQMGRTGMGDDMMVHLHYELQLNGKPVNPLPYFNTGNAPKKEGDYKVEKTKINVNGTIKTVDTIKVNGNNYIKLQDIRDPNILIGYENKMPTVTVKTK